MKFAWDIAWKNIRRKPFRAAAMSVLVMFLSMVLFGGAFVVISLQNGILGYQARLGADIIVVPSSASGHGTVDDILLQGITGNYYISKKELDKINKIEGIEVLTKQFFLTSAKAGCCSARVQIIGFDPETDFSILSWINESYSGVISDGDIVIGADINLPADGKIKFYGNDYHVAAQLSKTGTGLDNAVYTNMNTIQKMAESAANILETENLKNVNINQSASAVLIKVKDGYDINAVKDDINIHITKVEAVSSQSMVSAISEGLSGVSDMIGFLIGAVWLLAVIILMIVFMMLSNERKKEFAILRVMGASQKMLFSVMGAEAACISFFGGVSGLLIAVLMSFSLSDFMKEALGLPFLMPSLSVTVLLCVGALVLSVLAGVLTALISAFRITKNETGLLLREDT